MARVRVALERLLHQERQPVHALAHVGAAGGKPDPRPTRERDHRLTRARSAAATTAGSGAPEIRTRSPPASSISISPEKAGTGSATHGGVAGVIATAAKPGTPAAGTAHSIPAPTRYSLRQAKSWLGLTPCRRATPCTVAPGPKVSATSRRLSSSDQRRRACPRKISTIRPLAPAPRLTTPRQPRRSGDPPSSPHPRKAAPAGRIPCLGRARGDLACGGPPGPAKLGCSRSDEVPEQPTVDLRCPKL